MEFIKYIFKKIVSKFGYKLVNSNNQQVSFRNFENLLMIYEININKLYKNSVPSNILRPKLLGKLLGTPPSEAYFIIQALFQSKNIIGDICEFGVAQGETSALIANEISQIGSKKLHLFDSFEGLPEPTEKDQLKDDIFSLGSMVNYKGSMSYPEDMVRSRLNAISYPSENYVIHKGFIDKVFKNDNNLPEAVSFAFVDFDFYEPIKLTLGFLHKVTTIGSIIIVDDYDYFSTGVKIAVDDWIKEMNDLKPNYECFIPDTIYGHFAVITKITN